MKKMNRAAAPKGLAILTLAAVLSTQPGCTHTVASVGAATKSAAPALPVLDLSPKLEPEQRLQLNPTGLPSVGQGPWTANPYRGQVEVLDAGRAVFHAACARCHGVEAEPTPEAPDLRRLNSFCRRLQSVQLKDRCQSDVDRYFQSSVQEGKVRSGVVYMPSWKGVLSPEAFWAVRTYLESLKPPAPALLPVRAAGSAL